MSGDLSHSFEMTLYIMEVGQDKAIPLLALC